jgi:transposase-like protein
LPTASVGERHVVGTKWYLDEVVITIADKKHWLWRAVDQEGFVLDMLAQSRRDKKAAERLRNQAFITWAEVIGVAMAA